VHLETNTGVVQEIEDWAAGLRLLDDLAQALVALVRVDDCLEPDGLKVRTHSAVAEAAANVDRELGLELDAPVGESKLSGGAVERNGLAATRAPITLWSGDGPSPVPPCASGSSVTSTPYSPVSITAIMPPSLRAETALRRISGSLESRSLPTCVPNDHSSIRG
jgi:hypothetical protein